MVSSEQAEVGNRRSSDREEALRVKTGCERAVYSVRQEQRQRVEAVGLSLGARLSRDWDAARGVRGGYRVGLQPRLMHYLTK